MTKTSIETQIQSVAGLFPKWTDVIRKHTSQLYEDDGDILEEHIQTSKDLHSILEKILLLCSAQGDFKDTWDFPAKIRVLPFGQEAVIESQKMGITFVLGLYHGDIFLQTDLHHPLYIKNMPDDFWSNFIELQSLGDFHFLENAVPSGDDADKLMKELKNTKSNIFQLIRNYVLFEVYQGGSVDLGSMDIKWPFTTPWASLIENCVKAFGKFYKINYMLYRMHYLHINRRKALS